MCHLAREHLIEYTRLCDRKYIAEPVHYYLAEKLERLVDRKIKRLIINMPPRHGKSRLVTIEMPTWALGRNPSLQIVSTSYASSLVIKHSILSRTRMSEAFYQRIFNTRLDPNKRSADEWYVSGGGSYKATTVEGQLTGFGADILIVDDPFRGFAEAHSETMRENVWEWFLANAYTRLSENGVIVIIMTRWHVDDLVGRLLDPSRQEQMQDSGAKDEVWEVINLPAIATEDDMIGREIGQALSPARYPVSRLNSIRLVEGAYKWAALYEGNPVPKGGNYIDSSNFVVKNEVPQDLRWCRFWDLATSEKEKDDFTAGVKAAVDKEGNLWLSDMITGQWDWPKARHKITQTANAEVKQVKIIGVEAVGGFKTAYANLLEVMAPHISLREWKVDKDKLTRALPWIAMTERKKVFVVAGEWNVPFFTQCEAFPAGAHDDMIDAVTGAYEMLHSNIGFMPVNVPKAATALSYRRERSLAG